MGRVGKPKLSHPSESQCAYYILARCTRCPLASLVNTLRLPLCTTNLLASVDVELKPFLTGWCTHAGPSFSESAWVWLSLDTDIKHGRVSAGPSVLLNNCTVSSVQLVRNWCGKFTLQLHGTLLCLRGGTLCIWMRCKKVVTNRRRKSDDLGMRAVWVYMHLHAWILQMLTCRSACASLCKRGSSREQFPLSPTHLAWHRRLSLKEGRNLRLAYRQPSCRQPVKIVLTLMQTLVILNSFGLQSCSWSVWWQVCALRQQVHIYR